MVLNGNQKLDYNMVNKYTIFRLVCGLNEGSIGRTAEQLGQLVQSKGWRSFIAYSRVNYGSTSEVYRVDNKFSTLFHALLTRLFDMCGYGSYFATKRLVNVIERERPDLIHMHIIHNYDINLKVLFNYLSTSGIPIVWTQHDCWSYTGHCAYYSNVACEKWKTECHNCPQFNVFPKSWFYDGSKRNYRFKKKVFTSVPQNKMCIVAVSEYVKKDIEQSFLNKYRIKRIYNGIDTDRFLPLKESNSEVRANYGLGDGILLMGFATAWTERKGISDYYKLRKKLDKRYTIVFVGVDEQLKKTLPEGIIGIENTSSIEELVKLYSTADIVMNLASEESFGKTTPEGMACGTPSIVYNSTASPELVDEKTGIICEKGDIDGVVNAINTVLSWDKEETIRNCRNRVLSLFSMQKNWNEYIELYEEMIKENNKNEFE